MPVIAWQQPVCGQLAAALAGQSDRRSCRLRRDLAIGARTAPLQGAERRGQTGRSGYFERMARPRRSDSARVPIGLEVSEADAERIDQVLARPEFAPGRSQGDGARPGPFRAAANGSGQLAGGVQPPSGWLDRSGYSRCTGSAATSGPGRSSYWHRDVHPHDGRSARTPVHRL
jgi:hypothetical protein